MMNTFEVYRQVGEFYGKLKRGLGFGILTMREEENLMFTFNWYFTIRRVKYSLTLPMNGFDLIMNADIDFMVKRYIDEMRMKVRGEHGRT